MNATVLHRWTEGGASYRAVLVESPSGNAPERIDAISLAAAHVYSQPTLRCVVLEQQRRDATGEPAWVAVAPAATNLNYMLRVLAEGLASLGTMDEAVHGVGPYR